jgi:hypothetical protein
MKYHYYDAPFWVGAIIKRLNKINRKVNIMTDNQTKLNEDVQAILGGLAAIENEIATLKAQPAAEDIDFSGLDAVVARIQGDVPGDSVIGAPVDAPVEEPAPVDTTPVDTTPVVTTPVVTAPVDETPVEAAPVEDAPVDEVPAPAEDAPVEPTDDGAPVDVNPENAGDDDAPLNTIPNDLIDDEQQSPADTENINDANGAVNP